MPTKLQMRSAFACLNVFMLYGYLHIEAFFLENLKMTREKCEGTLFIHAVGIHTGGGLILLKALLKRVEQSHRVCLLADYRADLQQDLVAKIQVERFYDTYAGRLKAEHWLNKKSTKNDIVLCFSNLPPLFPLEAIVIVFLQNRLILDSSTDNQCGMMAKIRLALLRTHFKLFKRNADIFVVQTNSMKKLLSPTLSREKQVKVWPFIHDKTMFKDVSDVSCEAQRDQFTFFYPASAEPHKNHDNLLEAWNILAQNNIRPKLVLTVGPDRLAAKIDSLIMDTGARIENLGQLTHDETIAKFKEVDALIFPSKMESWGLPLVEADMLGLPILAPEMDYVRDVVDPNESFDPDSALSISNAVKRKIGLQDARPPVLEAGTFLQQVLNV